MIENRGRGRPKAGESVSIEDLLQATLRAFALHGYEGVSLRTLTRELGVSHNLLYQRFGTKDELWRAAVDFGFGQLVVHLHALVEPSPADLLDQLNLAIRRFIVYSAQHPELLGLMNNEGRQDTWRLAYIFDTYLEPSLALVSALLEQLVDQGVVRPVAPRTLFFLVASGGAAPYTLTPLADRFDTDAVVDTEAVEAHAALVADLLIGGLRKNN
ncbi:TetR/AcrR family transcriptional regulator [Nocardia sp. NPDC055049]